LGLRGDALLKILGQFFEIASADIIPKTKEFLLTNFDARARAEGGERVFVSSGSWRLRFWRPPGLLFAVVAFAVAHPPRTAARVGNVGRNESPRWKRRRKRKEEKRAHLMLKVVINRWFKLRYASKLVSQ
jgi:hypothetical protein